MTMTPEEFLTGAEGQELTLRELMSYWGHSVRNHRTIREVRDALNQAGLTTDPLFEDARDARQIVRIIPVEQGPLVAQPSEDLSEDAPAQVSFRVGDLPSADCEVLSVGLDDSLDYARTLMMRHDYSQLAIMDGKHLRGAITWESISTATLRGVQPSLRTTLDPNPEVLRSYDELLTQLPRIQRVGFAFVEDEDHHLVGIVTTADLAGQLANLAVPFLLISEIECRLRRHIQGICSVLDMKTKASRPNKVNSVNDLVFGECQAIFQDDLFWGRLNWGLDRLVFVEDLDNVRKIRNDIMHFRPNPLSDDKIVALEDFARWLRQLDPHP